MWFNPIMKALLKSPLHFFVSKNMMLLTYKGRKSGRLYTTPVSYLEMDGLLITISSRERVWWRNLRQRALVALLLAGQQVSVWGSVIEQQNLVVDALREYFQHAPERAQYFGVDIDPSNRVQDNALEALARDKVVVRFERSAEEYGHAESSESVLHRKDA